MTAFRSGRPFRASLHALALAVVAGMLAFALDFAAGACKAFLARNEKARLRERLETNFIRFEQSLDWFRPERAAAGT